MRIISGEARGVKIATPEGDDTRPTMERVKEAMFSTIQFGVPGSHVLDLYAGSGQLGIEALSRGATYAVFVDANKKVTQIIHLNLKACKLAEKAEVFTATAESYLARTSKKFDYIFLDPPYGQNTIEKILPKVEKVTAENGIVFCETETSATLPEKVGSLILKKKYKYGRILLWRYQKTQEEEE
jgi:RNA methyltransferase, RsmD family